MQFFILFLVFSFLAGGLGFTRILRDRPIVLLACCTFFATGFYSLRVVL